MATPRWRGGATPVAQVNTFAFGGTWEADDLIRVTAGAKIKDLAAGSATTNTVVTNTDTNIDALSATTFPEIKSTESGITASVAVAGTLTLTANTAGVPFTISLTPLEANGGAADAQTIEGAGTVTTGTIATANNGPNVWSTAANWDTGIAPTTGDTFYIDNNDHDILYGLSVAGATVAAGHISMSFTGTIGLPKANVLGTEYPEYRTDYLTLDCSVWHVGTGVGPGSGRIKINSGSVQTAVNVYNTGSPLESDVEALVWKGTNASNTLTARGDSSVGVAIFGAETAVIATLTVDDNARVRCGPGTTLTTITVHSGELEVNSAIAGTLLVLGGKVTINLAATVAQLTIRGGEVVYNSTGTISGNTVLAGDGVLDFAQAPGAVTVSNPIEMYGPNCRLVDTNKRTGAVVVDLNEEASESQLDLGRNIRLTRGTPA